MKTTVAVLLFVAGLANALPLVGVLGADRLATLYGMTVTDPDVLLLLRHRAVLFGLLGGFVMFAAFRPALHGGALLAILVSMLSFVVLAWATDQHHSLIDKVVIADVVLCTMLFPALLIHIRPPATA